MSPFVRKSCMILPRRVNRKMERAWIEKTETRGGQVFHWAAESIEVLDRFREICPFEHPPEGAGVAKISRSRFVIRIEWAPGQAVYIKRYRLLDWKRRAASWVHSSKVRRERELTEGAVRRGISVPRAMATLEIRRGGRLVESYLVQEAIEPAVSLETLLRRSLHLEPLTEPDRFRAALIRFLTGIQQKGFKHEDLRIDHILIREPVSDSPVFVLIDLDGAKLSNGPLGLSRIVQNLVQLNRSTWGSGLSAWDRLRFLREFIKVHPRLGHYRAGPLWRRIAVESALRRKKSPSLERLRLRSRYEFNGKIPEALSRMLKEE